MIYGYLVWFSLAWLIILYFLNTLIARRFPKIELKKLFVYVAGVALIGVFGEVLIDSLYKIGFGQPFWIYKLLPAHSEFTSYYSPFLWGMFGFHLYLFHETLFKLKPTLKDWKLACIFALEAVALELIFNLSHILIKGTYIFYYLPSDLWHLTSFTALPFYFIGGYALVLTLKRFTKDPLFFGLLSIIGIFTILVFSS